MDTYHQVCKWAIIRSLFEAMANGAQISRGLGGTLIKVFESAKQRNSQVNYPLVDDTLGALHRALDSHLDVHHERRGTSHGHPTIHQRPDRHGHRPGLVTGVVAFAGMSEVVTENGLFAMMGE